MLEQSLSRWMTLWRECDNSGGSLYAAPREVCCWFDCIVSIDFPSVGLFVFPMTHVCT
jgi:hypothetical protein